MLCTYPEQELVLHDALDGFDEEVGQRELVAETCADLLEHVVQVVAHHTLRLGLVLAVLDVHVQAPLLCAHVHVLELLLHLLLLLVLVLCPRVQRVGAHVADEDVGDAVRLVAALLDLRAEHAAEGETAEATRYEHMLRACSPQENTFSLHESLGALVVEVVDLHDVSLDDLLLVDELLRQLHLLHRRHVTLQSNSLYSICDSKVTRTTPKLQTQNILNV